MKSRLTYLSEEADINPYDIKEVERAIEICEENKKLYKELKKDTRFEFGAIVGELYFRKIISRGMLQICYTKPFGKQLLKYMYKKVDEKIKETPETNEDRGINVGRDLETIKEDIIKVYNDLDEPIRFKEVFENEMDLLVLKKRKKKLNKKHLNR